MKWLLWLSIMWLSSSSHLPLTRGFVVSPRIVRTISRRHSQQRDHVEQIIQAALQSVDPYRAVKDYLISTNDDMIRNAKHVRIAAFGKASAAMAAAVVDSSMARCNVSGICICKDGHAETYGEHLRTNGVEVYEASHPIPDERGVQASKKLFNFVNSANHRDTAATTNNTVTICCISGGGSALFCTPKISLKDLQTTNQRLLESGLDITKMNQLRQVLEDGKGGGLHADIALILSDVIGDPLESIASGPTVKPERTCVVDWSFLETIDLPDSVREILSRPLQMRLPDNHEKNCRNVLVGNNAKAVNAAVAQAQKLGYTVNMLGTEIQGEASKIGKDLVRMVEASGPKKSQEDGSMIGEAWIGGGETTVTLPRNHGLGGRNQELVLAAAIAMKQDMIVASIGTDGTDGPTDAAGGIVDANTVGDTMAEAVAALEGHDAYSYLEKRNALYKTGPTGTNVADLFVVLKRASSG